MYTAKAIRVLDHNGMIRPGVISISETDCPNVGREWTMQEDMAAEKFGITELEIDETHALYFDESVGEVMTVSLKTGGVTLEERTSAILNTLTSDEIRTFSLFLASKGLSGEQSEQVSPKLKPLFDMAESGTVRLKTIAENATVNYLRRLL